MLCLTNSSHYPARQLIILKMFTQRLDYGKVDSNLPTFLQT